MRKPIRIICLSTYIPQKCGIATFTKDVTSAINLLNPHAIVEIMAVVKDHENFIFPWEVKYKIIQSNQNSYLEAANYINHSSCDVVLIEHEFGIYGGRNGEYLIPFLKAVSKPKVMTCHTIIDDPQNEWGRVFQKILKNIDALTVMTQNSAQKIIDLYKFPKNLIAVIPHGTPDITYNSTEIHKKKRNLSGRLILGNINLLSKRVGVEYSLKAVAKIAKKYPQVLYLIIGQTHPNILENEGEKYRNFLKKKIRKLGIQKNVRFINKYLTIEELIDWLKVIDFYITPYLDPQQSSSGALAYALGAGKVCISTPYLYAQEVLSHDRGVLVPFKNSAAISQSVLKIFQDPRRKKQIERKAYQYGRFMTWPSIALQHLDLFTEIIKKHDLKYPKAD